MGEGLLRAYDDTEGVTAQFNLNLPARINRELGGDFHLHRFWHVARWNDAERAVEMQLAQPHRAVGLDRSTPIPLPGGRDHPHRELEDTIAKASARSQSVRAGARRRPGRTTSACSACSRSCLSSGGVRADMSPRGVAAKPQAAAAAGSTRVMLPARNRRDYDNIPAGAREKLEFVWLERVDDAIAAALEGGSNPGCAGSRCCDADRAVRGGRAARAVTARPARPTPVRRDHSVTNPALRSRLAASC